MARKLTELTKDELIAKIADLEDKLKKRYGLVWDREKEPEKIVVDCERNVPVLQSDKTKEIIGSGEENVLIEGDNYHALTCLNYTHRGKIDFIYIDPPYNTGKKNEWKYNDRYIDINDNYRHSKWLNFMEKRLNLAKSLLSPNGFIAISINDIEQANLKLLCDKIFGQDFFYAQLTWINRTQPTNMGKAMYNIQKNIDYVLVYGKTNPTKFQGFQLYQSEQKSYPEKDEKGFSFRYEALAQRKNKGTLKRDSMLFPVLGIHPKMGYRWQISLEKYQELQQKDRLIKKGEKIYQKIYPEDEENPCTLMPFWGHMEEVDTSQIGKKELNEILGPSQELETVKPLSLLTNLLFHIANKNSVILDFFAGSGTTGHAVLEMNKQDGGHRRFILCTNNEGNICTDVCYPRLKKVIEGYTNATTQELIAGLGTNLTYYKTALIPVERIDKVSDKQRVEITRKAGTMIGLKENTLKEIELTEYYQIYTNQDGTRKTAIYFREDESRMNELIKKLANVPTALYVFSYSKVDKDAYKDLGKDIRVEDIPEPLLQIYKEINLKIEEK